MPDEDIMKKIKAVYRAGYTDYDGLDTYRAFPLPHLPIDALDPFLFLNHHGRQVYAPGNGGLPFGPHPHKGFETVTFIVEGALIHQDSTGFSSHIREGGVQWMTAGKGILHSETSSEAFRKEGGAIEILQLWVNLPARLKNTEPAYLGLQKEEIPVVRLDEERVLLYPVSGDWGFGPSPVQSLFNVALATVNMKKGGSFLPSVPEGHTLLFYLIRGRVQVNGTEAEQHDLVEFEPEGTEVNIQADEDSLILFGHAEPTREPVVAHGPFVMNTQEEIRQAFVDYQNGKLGTWPEKINI